MVVPGNQHINSNVCILPCQNRHIMDMDCPFPVQSIPGGFPFLPFRFLLVGRGKRSLPLNLLSILYSYIFILKMKEFLFGESICLHDFYYINTFVQ